MNKMGSICESGSISTKRKLIYIWEYGSGLGHVSVFLSTAEMLRAEGWEVKFYLPRLGVGSRESSDILRSKQFEYDYVPGAQYRRKRDFSIKSHVDLLMAIDSFSSEDVIGFYIDAWSDIFHHEQPDVVLNDFALLPGLVARVLGFKTLAVDAGYYYPDMKSDEIIPFKATKHFDKNLADHHLQQILKNINQAFFSKGISAHLKTLADIYKCDELLITNFPELCSTEHEKHHFIGGNVRCVSNEKFIEPSWPSLDPKRPKVFCYLHLDQMPGAKLFQVALSMDWVDFIIYSPSVASRTINTSEKPHIHLVGQPVNLESILKETDAVICHGGVSLICQSLWRGKPVLAVPTHLEQKLNGDKLQELQYGLCISANEHDHDAIYQYIHTLLSDPQLKFNARSFSLGKSHLKPSWKTLHETITKPTCKPIKKLKSTKRDRLNTKKLDVIFLSYDEPNADQNWAALKTTCPWAKRVHGIRGFDASHKAAAEASSTHRFILIDGDNGVDPDFFEIDVEIPLSLTNSIWQWRSHNFVNGLNYAAGGIKIWPKSVVESMQSHELCNSNDSLALDFWDQPGYAVFNNIYSTNYINGSPLQAYRAGYREGVKYGVSIQRYNNRELIRRVAIWASVGADVENGQWSMLGARHGLLNAFSDQKNVQEINDYAHLQDEWKALIKAAPADLNLMLKKSLEEIECLKVDIPVVEMSAEESKEFKKRLNTQDPQHLNVFELTTY